jgi:hypothetical protein
MAFCRSRPSLLLLSAAMTACIGPAAEAQISNESPPPMLQWFECRWQDIERRMSD